MKVLLASFDLFKGVGGGQTLYRNVILRNPQIQFTYLRNSEPPGTSRPRHAQTVACPSVVNPVPEATELFFRSPSLAVPWVRPRQ